MNLGAVSNDRDNNFNLIRMIAAAAVLVSHAYPITGGMRREQPLEGLVGMTLGDLAVSVFFVISGFLITRSFDRSSTTWSWTAARLLRLFPALIVVVLLTVFVLGPATTHLGLESYFTNPRTYEYILRNLTLVSLQYDLPGVFPDAPLVGAINGSLWTLFHEVMCYFGVFVCGVAGLLRRPKLFAAALAAYFVGYFALAHPEAAKLATGQMLNLRKLSFPFAIGMALYMWRDHVRLHWLWVVVLGAAAYGGQFTPFAREAFLVWACYATFYLGYVPGGFVRRYNGLGDYSYGVYIYAYPMQQLMLYLAGDMTPIENMLYAFPATLFLAVLSWRIVEAPALAAKAKVVRPSRRRAPMPG